MNEINHVKGIRAETAVVLRALDKGYIVSRPVSDYARYDLVLDDGSALRRVQVKFAGAPVRNGTVKVHLEKKNRNNRFRYSKEEIDLLMIVFQDRNIILCFGPEHFDNKSALMIRFEPAKTTKGKPPHWFENFIW